MTVHVPPKEPIDRTPPDPQRITAGVNGARAALRRAEQAAG